MAVMEAIKMMRLKNMRLDYFQKLFDSMTRRL
jgi:hypothetical protein